VELFRYGQVGFERPAVRADDGTTFSAESLTRDYDSEFFGAEGVERVAAALDAGELSPVDVSGQRIGAPTARPPAVIGIGMNYAAHAAETGAQPPQYPIVFLKHPSSIIGATDDVIMPPGSEKSDWEVELAVIIKKSPRYLTDVAQALDYVAGYALANDLSERAWQIETSGGQWTKGKCAETYFPIGPVVRPAAEIDPTNLRLRTWINGELRQDSSTADMVFSVAELIVDLSRHMLLLPGDIISTGTPQGVAMSGKYPYLKVGDEIAMEIEGLGRQEQKIVAYAG
jgi:2,4-didehydro-3-deoxy-L-rhamnonate hydrolase